MKILDALSDLAADGLNFEYQDDQHVGSVSTEWINNLEC